MHHSEIIHHIINAVNARDMQKVNGLFTDDFIRHDLTSAIAGTNGSSGAVNLLQQILSAFPDLKIQIDDIIEDPKKTAVRMTFTGTHEGVFLEFPPTGNKIQVSNVNIYRFEGSQIAELWQLLDLAGLFRQIGKTRI